MSTDTQSAAPRSQLEGQNLIAAVCGKLVTAVIPQQHTQAEWVDLWRRFIVGVETWRAGGPWSVAVTLQALSMVAAGLDANDAGRRAASASPAQWIATQLQAIFTSSPDDGLQRESSTVAMVAIQSENAALAAGIAELVREALVAAGLAAPVKGRPLDVNPDTVRRLREHVSGYEGNRVGIGIMLPSARKSNPPAAA